MLNNYPAIKPSITNPGTISIRTNMIRVNSNPMIVHQYAVTFDPIVHKLKAADIFYRETKFFFSKEYAFDGIAILITKDRFENDKTIIKYANGSNNIIISYNNSYDITDVYDFINEKHSNNINVHLQCLDIISRGFQSRLELVELGKIFSEDNHTKIDNIFNIWTGLKQNFRVTKLGLFNNVDLAFRVTLQNCSLLEFIVKLASENNTTSRERSNNMQSDDGPGRNIRRGGNSEENGIVDEIERNRRLGGYTRNNNQRDSEHRDESSRQRNNNYRQRREGYNQNHSRYGGNSNNQDNDQQPNITFEAVYNNEELLNFALAKLKIFIKKKLKFTTKHMTRDRNFSFVAKDISEFNSTQIKFNFENNEISVAEYFKKNYEELTYPELPLIIKKKGENEVSYYPMEVLDLKTNQKFSEKLNDFQASRMIKVSAKRPTDRFRIIEQKIREFKANNNPTLKEFNIVYDNNFLACKGKVLSAPELEFGPGKKQFVNPINGTWNIRDLKALSPVKIKNWVFAYHSNIRTNNNIINTAMQSLSAICQSFGVELNTYFEIVKISNCDDFITIIEPFKPTFVLFLLASKDSEYYSKLKLFSETINNPVITQCILSSNLKKFDNPTFCSNIAMKLNSKLNGKNWKIASNNNPITSKSTIVFGADVNHPGKGDEKTPSIAAVTASIDINHTEYTTQIQEQENRQEIIDNIRPIILSMINKYIQKNVNEKPERIIFFRDGVGESQFYSVYKNEILGIKEAFKDIDPNYNPKLTYIIAQKRHSIRFQLLNNSRNSNSYQNKSTGNVTPGTVVDDISHPILYDFYMVSHFAMQGTARPIRYQVLLDENDFPVQEIQEIINNMCYQYPRATKAVSIVAPIYFAHLAAARGKCYHNVRNTRTNEVINYNSNLKDQLFYM